MAVKQNLGKKRGRGTPGFQGAMDPDGGAVFQGVRNPSAGRLCGFLQQRGKIDNRSNLYEKTKKSRIHGMNLI